MGLEVVHLDTLGPGISDLLNTSSQCGVTATSVLALPWTPQDMSRNLHLAYDSSSSSSPSPKKDEQPLNMCIKRWRGDKGSSSQLRDILTDTKDHHSLSKTGHGASDNVRSIKRPHVFRYTTGLTGSMELHRAPTTSGQGQLLLSANGPLPLPAHHNQCNSSASSGSTHYPSSPGSGRSFSGGSLAGDSPPRVVSPSPALPAAHSHQQMDLTAPLAGLPIFALHPSGMYYIPMTLNPANLDPAALHQLTTASSLPTANPGAVCHPITITVNFCQQINAINSATPGSVVQAQRSQRMSPVDPRQVGPARDGVILAAASSTNA